MSNHLDDRQLLPYMEHALPPKRRQQADAHLRACPTCSLRLARLTETAEGLAATLRAAGGQVPLASGRSWEAIAGQLPQARQKRPLLAAVLLRPSLRYAATLAILVALAAGLTGLFHVLANSRLASIETAPATPTTSPNGLPAALLTPPVSSPRPTAPVSILILGVDGESATSNEIDMLLLLHIDPGAKRAFLLSIPRDLYVTAPGYGQMRAGSVYRISQQDGQAGGLALARETISATLGLPVQHAALVRFAGFVTLIDAVGGVDVDVPYPINDPSFPDGRGGYDPLIVPAGRHHFNGAFALRYARTRVTPAAGFDRSFRQRQIVLAVHERVTRLNLLPELLTRAPDLWEGVTGTVETDLCLRETSELALWASRLTENDIATASLEACCTTDYVTAEGERVLLPQEHAVEELFDTLLSEEQE